MTQSKEVSNLKRIKYLFRIFLKQFHVDEYKLLMQYLQLSINRFNSNSLVEVLGQSNNKRRRKNAPASKIANIEQTISMLKSRNDNNNTNATSPANSDESNNNKEEMLSEVALDDEELKLINEASCFGKEESDDLIYEENVHGNSNGYDGEDFSYNSENIQYNDEEQGNVSYNNTPVKLYNNKSFPQQQQQQHRPSKQLNHHQQSDDYDEGEYLENSEREVGEVYHEDGDYIENDNYVLQSQQNSYGQAHHLNASMSILTSHLNAYKGIQTQAAHLTPQPKLAAKPKFISGFDVKPEPVVLAKNSTSTNGILAQNIYQAHSQSPKKFIRKFNDEIRYELEAKFVENNFISGVEKDQLAVKLNLTERQVKKWFEKRREKKRRIEKMIAAGHACKIGRPPSNKKPPMKTPTKKINALAGSHLSTGQQHLPNGNQSFDYNNQNEDCEEYEDTRCEDGNDEEFSFSANDNEYFNEEGDDAYFDEAEENEMAGVV